MCKHAYDNFNFSCSLYLYAWIFKYPRVKSIKMGSLTMQGFVYVKHFLVTRRMDSNSAYMEL